MAALNHMGVGASLPRLEDERFPEGRGQFVADISYPRMLHAAFVRSTHAHARLIAISKPAGRENRVFVAADLDISIVPLRKSGAGFRRPPRIIQGPCRSRQLPLSCAEFPELVPLIVIVMLFEPNTEDMPGTWLCFASTCAGTPASRKSRRTRHFWR